MLSYFIMPGILLLILIIVLVIVCVCAWKEIYPWEIPEELWDYFTWHLPEKRFQKKVVLKHKKGDMTGIVAVTSGQYIDADDVICRKITGQDVVSVNLDLLTWALMTEGRPATWAEKVKELAQNSKAIRAILKHREYDSQCKVPEELLEAILADENSLEKIADYLGCFSVVGYMAEDGSKAANKIMNIVRERGEKKHVK